MLDFANGYTDNFPTTGGVPLHAFPVFYYAGSLTTYLGEIPAIRMCSLAGIPTGEVLTYGSDEYMVFPWVQRGTGADAGDGGTYNGQPNSYTLGWAIRKEA